MEIQKRIGFFLGPAFFVATLLIQPFELELPLFLPIMVALLVGLGIGLAYEWLVHGKHRRAVRRMDSELKRVKAEDETPKADHPKSDHKALGHS